jgi:3-hydroxyisobutyrate dehydrogenase-like beta-hydroxyacid dehydrogenase
MRLVSKQLFSFSKVGFIGLGNMGLPMATNLTKKGFTVLGYDTDTSKAKAISDIGIKLMPIKEIAKEVDAFITMLPNTDHSYSVCQSP